MSVRVPSEPNGSSNPLSARYQLGSASLGTTAPTRGTAASTRLAGEATTAGSRAARAARLEPATAAGGGGTTGVAVVAASIGVGLGTSLLNDDVLAVDGVGAGAQGGVVAGLGLEFDKGTVLFLG